MWDKGGVRFCAAWRAHAAAMLAGVPLGVCAECHQLLPAAGHAEWRRSRVDCGDLPSPPPILLCPSSMPPPPHIPAAEGSWVGGVAWDVRARLPCRGGGALAGASTQAWRAAGTQAQHAAAPPGHSRTTPGNRFVSLRATGPAFACELLREGAHLPTTTDTLPSASQPPHAPPLGWLVGAAADLACCQHPWGLGIPAQQHHAPTTSLLLLTIAL
jgi:hypothetical protein